MPKHRFAVICLILVLSACRPWTPPPIVPVMPVAPAPGGLACGTPSGDQPLAPTGNCAKGADREAHGIHPSPPALADARAGR